jgi:hypothetical protein
LGGDITVLLGLVPGLADDTAIVRAQDSFISFISGDGGDGSGDGGCGSSRLSLGNIPSILENKTMSEKIELTL